MTGSAVVLRANANNLPLPDGSVDLIVTSPPYFSLRSYSDDGSHYPGQIGDEPTPGEFLEALWACTAEWQRVLKPSGSLFVNLGDKYAERTVPARDGGRDDDNVVNRASARPRRGRRGDIRAKSLMGLPWRYAIGCIDGDAGQLPWILRAEVVWSKPNAMPESVNDRVRRTHETWFHLTKADRYYAAIDELRETHTGKPGYSDPSVRNLSGNGVTHRTFARNPNLFNPLGRLPGSVWEVPSEPLNIPSAVLAARGLDDHYASYPQEWPRRLILGWSPPGICVECGEGRRPVVDVEQQRTRAAGTTGRPKRQDLEGNHGSGWDDKGYPVTASTARIVGYRCACTPYTVHEGEDGERPTEQDRSADLGDGRRDNPGGGYGNYERRGPWREYHLDRWRPAPTRPAVVLDPFGGTGTTAGVARSLDRHGISVDLSHGYSRLARWRIFESGHFAKSASRTWGERQGSLFDALDVPRQTVTVPVGEAL